MSVCAVYTKQSIVSALHIFSFLWSAARWGSHTRCSAWVCRKDKTPACPSPPLVRLPSFPPNYDTAQKPPVYAHCSPSPHLTPTSCPRRPFVTPRGHVKSERSSGGLIRHPRLTWGNVQGWESRQGGTRCSGWGLTYELGGEGDVVCTSGEQLKTIISVPPNHVVPA